SCSPQVWSTRYAWTSYPSCSVRASATSVRSTASTCWTVRTRWSRGTGCCTCATGCSADRIRTPLAHSSTVLPRFECAKGVPVRLGWWQATSGHHVHQVRGAHHYPPRLGTAQPAPHGIQRERPPTQLLRGHVRGHPQVPAHL